MVRGLKRLEGAKRRAYRGLYFANYFAAAYRTSHFVP
jgi:hypothetical protein